MNSRRNAALIKSCSEHYVEEVFKPTTITSKENYTGPMTFSHLRCINCGQMFDYSVGDTLEGCVVEYFHGNWVKIPS